MSKTPKLNIPKDKSIQFDDVAFVNGMSEYQLKVLVKRIWGQLMELANTLDNRRDDMPPILDKILNGVSWNKNDIHDRFQYGICKDFTIQYDTLKRTFIFLDENREPIGNPVHAISVSEGKEFAKEERKPK